MISIAGLTKIFKTQNGDVRALDGIDLVIGDGDIFGIIGLSGAGKSTLIRCLNLLEKPTSGSIKIDGREITLLKEAELRELRRSLGMIFQNFNLLMQRTAEDNVAFPMEIAGVDKGRIKERVKELLEIVGLTDKAKSYPAQLSGGQKQRVAIARALANNPRVLLCDEATSALDPMTTKSILSLLQGINRKLGITIVIITHEMSVIKEICNKVAVIDNTRIVESGSVIEVVANPKSEAARRLFGHTLPPLDYSAREGLPAENLSVMRIKLKFTGDAAVRPIISNAVRRFNIHANILFGNLEVIQEAILGELILELAGEEKSVSGALDYFGQEGLAVEELKG